MKRRMLTGIGALVGLYLLVLGIHVSLMAIHATSYMASLRGDYDLTSLNKQSRNLAADINHIFTDLNVPVVKEIAGTLGVDFSPVRDEAIATVKASSWLAGADAPKRYIIAFQNSAEARGTGGILGAFAIVQISKGNLTVIRTGSNAILKSLEELPIRMPSDFVKLYGSDPAIWQNSNISPHFPYAAQIWMALWKKQFGEQLDGVIAVDPSALSYVLRATGPITLKSGEVITSQNVVAETLQKAYQRYETNNDARKQYLVDIMNAAAAKITSGQFSKVGMAKAFKRGLLENRILIFSRDKAAEDQLASVRLGGILGSTRNNEFRSVIINTDASKLDYYLTRTTNIQSLGCGKDSKIKITVTLKNSLKSGVGLPAYVLTRADKTKPAALVSGQHRFLDFIYGPTGSNLISAKRSSAFGSPGGIGEERHRPLLAVDVDLAPGQEERITAVFTRGYGPVTYRSQPLVIKEKVSTDDKC